MMFVAEVKFTPEVVKKWVVARRNRYTAELEYYKSYNDREDAEDMAQELDDGIVLEKVEA